MFTKFDVTLKHPYIFVKIYNLEASQNVGNIFIFSKIFIELPVLRGSSLNCVHGSTGH